MELEGTLNGDQQWCSVQVDSLGVGSSVMLFVMVGCGVVGERRVGGLGACMIVDILGCLSVSAVDDVAIVDETRESVV